MNYMIYVPPWNVINFELIPHGAASVSGESEQIAQFAYPRQREKLD